LDHDPPISASQAAGITDPIFSFLRKQNPMDGKFLTQTYSAKDGRLRSTSNTLVLSSVLLDFELSEFKILRRHLDGRASKNMLEGWFVTQVVEHLPTQVQGPEFKPQY
jgi:hypothetical protein